MTTMDDQRDRVASCPPVLHVRTSGFSQHGDTEESARRAAALLRQVGNVLMQQPLGTLAAGALPQLLWRSPRSALDGFELLCVPYASRTDEEMAGQAPDELVEADYFDEMQSGDLDDYAAAYQAWLEDPRFEQVSADAVLRCAKAWHTYTAACFRA
jgi:hypothetical protein